LTVSGGANITNSGYMFEGRGSCSVLNSTLINNIGQVALGKDFFSLLNSTVTNLGEIARDTALVYVFSGSMTNEGSFATFAGTLTIGGSAKIYNEPLGAIGLSVYPSLIIQDNPTLFNEGQIGPCPITMNGGTIVNDGEIFTSVVPYSNFYLNWPNTNITTSAKPFMSQGTVFFPTASGYKNILNAQLPSSFNNGQILGKGSLILSGTNYLNIPITQGSVIVGQSFTPGGDFQASCFQTSPITADVIVTSLGQFFSQSQITGDVTVSPQGLLSPGGLNDPVEQMIINGSINLQDSSITEMDFDQSGNDLITILNGNLILGDVYSQPTLKLTALGRYPYQNRYVIFDLQPKLLETSEPRIKGYFNVVGDQPLISYNLEYTPDQIYLCVFCEPFSFYAKNPNELAIAELLDTLDLNTNDCLQTKMQEIKLLHKHELKDVYASLDNAEFKGQQIAIEETVFHINDKVFDHLRTHKKGSSVFIDGGFYKYNQNSYAYFDGFRSSAAYGLLGYTYGFDSAQILTSIGFFNTSVQYKHIPSKSFDSTIFANLGFLKLKDRWRFTLDGFGGANFLSLSRKIGYFDLNAHTHHGGYLAKIEGGIAYEKKGDIIHVLPYERLSYLYNHENSFHEHGASCLSLNVGGSNRQTIRNAVGFNMQFLPKKTIHPYIDLSYVYEYRFGGNAYTVQFVNTTPKATINGIETSKNFGKYTLGFLSQKDHLDFCINFDGIYSEKLKEYGLTSHFNYKF
jgi:hypothetical protein